MKKILKSLICISLVLILSASIVFATDETGSGGMDSTNCILPSDNDIPVETVIE